MRALSRLLGLACSEPEEQGPSDVVPSAEQPPPGISLGTVAMLERMKRKVAKAAATALTVSEARQVDAEIDEALARSGGPLLLEQFKARLGDLPGREEVSPEQPDLIQRGPASAEGGCERSERSWTDAERR